MRQMSNQERLAFVMWAKVAHPTFTINHRAQIQARWEWRTVKRSIDNMVKAVL